MSARAASSYFLHVNYMYKSPIIASTFVCTVVYIL